MKKFLFNGFLGLIACGLLSGCLQDEPENDQEVITKFTYTLTPEESGQTVILQFSDPDGEGGNAPVITTSGNLVEGKTYRGSISVQNEISMPPADITTEIKEEAEDHQFFYIPSGNLSGKISITYADIDNNADPVGLETQVQAIQKSTGGTLKIILRHQPDKSAPGVKNGDIQNAKGETDIEVEFDLTID